MLAHRGGGQRSQRAQTPVVVADDAGLSVSGGDPSFEQRFVGNAVFATTPISGGIASDNVTGSFATAASFLVAPIGVMPGMDLFPLPGALSGDPEDATRLPPVSSTATATSTGLLTEAPFAAPTPDRAPTQAGS
jgi:hypothetical protein